MSYFLGIDNGGTTTKAAIYDSYGREMAVASTVTEMLVPFPGFTERDMDDMWEANCLVIREVLDKSRIKAEEISAAACCGHGKGLYLWGKDGRPVRNGIISTDNRAWEYPLKWKKDGTAGKVFEKSYQQILASQPVSLLAWLKDHEPESMEKIQWIFECKDYIRFRLTGEARAELTDYSGSNFVNLNTGKYDRELLALFELAEYMDKLPPLCLSTDICGYVTEEAARKTGLKAGTPVAGGAFDIDACAIAVGAIEEAYICMIAGTWSINEYVRKQPVLDGTVMMNSFFCRPGYYLVEECSPTSAGNSEWFIQTLLPELKAAVEESGESIYHIMNQWVESVPASELCPVFLPFLMASNVHPNAKGCFVGISSYHSRMHLARSVYEGVAFSHRYHLEKLLKTRDTKPDSIRLAGGAAHSAVWTQIFADICNLPVEAVDANETGTLGSAIIGAVAVGEYTDLAEASTHMCRVSERVLPKQENRKYYDEKYALYLETIRALDCVWNKFENYKNK